jgi:hypothetical protein
MTNCQALKSLLVALNQPAHDEGFILLNKLNIMKLPFMFPSSDISFSENIERYHSSLE